MDFKQLQSFATVVKYGSFTKAAEKLYISQPTISTHIRQLEEELKTRFLIRTTKSLEVTPKGRELYEYAVSILELRDKLLKNCSAEGQKIIHLGASTIPSAYILPEVLPQFGQLNPETYFVIHQSDSQGVINGLLEGVFDVGLTGMAVEDTALAFEAFCTDRMVLITPVNEHFLALREESPVISSEQLAQEPMILREEGSGSRKSAGRFLENAGLTEERLQIMARINDQEAIKNLVAGGLGVSIISEKAARNFVEEKRLLQFELSGGGSTRNLYLAYRKDFIISSDVKAFLEFLLKKYSSEE